MAKKTTSRYRPDSSRPGAGRPNAGRPNRGAVDLPGEDRPILKRWPIVFLAVVVVVVVVLAADVVFGALTGSGSPSDTAPGHQTVHQAQGGSWTNVDADRLAFMLEHKDFTFVNVKTPYMGEIQGTDLYIPYDQIQARASQLPSNKGAKILVYCRSGNESAVAAQTLLNLGYTNIWNLDGGMTGWTDSGRKLIQLNRT